ncbi:properdin-like [Myripristis murdjan]|uniref:properdin-like n=1 Tax=Myripristis murdjan TaxID=586833 RepID=UPI001175EA77|nr:properdin [Myripristis murdjan]
MRLCFLLLLLLVCVQHAECVRCFSRVDLRSSLCVDELGEVDDEDDCCQNPHYGYQATDGECHSCGGLGWSSWSSWSSCSVLCGEGVRQRSRKCFSQSACPDVTDNLQMEPCSANCCDVEWAPWGAWSPCSVSCGGGGVRKRERACLGPDECRSSCSGSAETTESCNTHTTCPVHGGWSAWSQWEACSASCVPGIFGDDTVGVAYPTRRRQRTCSSPAPSSDTVPPGDGCPGDGEQVQDCSELPNCPVDGSWGAWSPPGPCSASCGEGLQLSIRECDSPAPKYGGRVCEGESARASRCESTCTVDGFWSGWSSWGECSASCIPAGRASVRTRQRSCSNPAPSASPPGQGCPGDSTQTESCSHLSHCPVDGSWGSWGPFSSCSVSCGVGLQRAVRRCDSPAPQHGGRPCAGAGSQTRICKTNVHCPVDGVWSDWSPWGQCQSPFSKDIRCKTRGGIQTRERRCLFRAHNGSICPADDLGLLDRRVCYDITGCYMKGSWAGWADWGWCSPTCGDKSRRVRKRICEPDTSNYPPTIGRLKEKAHFFGNPTADCRLAPGDKKYEVQNCLNAPPCP